MVPGGVDIAMGTVNVSPHVRRIINGVVIAVGLTRQSIIS
jgi:hypothetical protein